MAQALILCTLPYRQTSERQLTRSARLSDGSTLRVSFTAGLAGIDLPFGHDRHLMAWLFDKAISSDTSFVTIKSANDYLREVGKQRNGDRVKELAARLRRLTGLVIGVERPGYAATRTTMVPMIADSNLPNNLRLHLDAEGHGQKSIPGLENAFGVLIDERFFQDLKRHHIAVPRRLWLQLQGQKGGPHLHDLLTYFISCCYCAQSETVIPLAGLREQFPQDDSNPRRLKHNVKKAIIQLRVLWPQVQIDALKEGVWVAKAPELLLPDDPGKKRVRKLDVSHQKRHRCGPSAYIFTISLICNVRGRSIPTQLSRFEGGALSIIFNGPSAYKRSNPVSQVSTEGPDENFIAADLPRTLFRTFRVRYFGPSAYVISDLPRTKRGLSAYVYWTLRVRLIRKQEISSVQEKREEQESLAVNQRILRKTRIKNLSC